ncbi:unnamed protein product [Cylicocyclus nassatus]|uniref:Uncharacterized protein n=1 Tax=Cylicocyclus nassatus TaxID=53992 RepID=A0AA36M3B6_CYLNA|nr:unnamed protein product [Cylicocyclus nassatus]
MFPATLSVLAVSVVTADWSAQSLHQRSADHIYIACNDIIDCHENVPQTARPYYTLVSMTQQLMCKALEDVGNYGAVHVCELEEQALEYQRKLQQGPVDIEECHFSYRSSYKSVSSDDTDEDKVTRIFLSYEANITSALKVISASHYYAYGLVCRIAQQ